GSDAEPGLAAGCDRADHTENRLSEPFSPSTLWPPVSAEECVSGAAKATDRVLTLQHVLPHLVCHLLRLRVQLFVFLEVLFSHLIFLEELNVLVREVLHLFLALFEAFNPGIGVRIFRHLEPPMVNADTGEWRSATA